MLDASLIWEPKPYSLKMRNNTYITTCTTNLTTTKEKKWENTFFFKYKKWYNKKRQTDKMILYKLFVKIILHISYLLENIGAKIKQ